MESRQITTKLYNLAEQLIQVFLGHICSLFTFFRGRSGPIQISFFRKRHFGLDNHLLIFRFIFLHRHSDNFLYLHLTR
jgi:hypothetical protein